MADSWTLYVDGSSADSGSGAGVVLISPEDLVTEYALRFSFPATNNEAEYEAVLAGLRLCRDLGVSHVRLLCDSKLVVEQISGEYDANEKMAGYLSLVTPLLRRFSKAEVCHIPRSENTRADALSKLASSTTTFSTRTVHVKVLASPSLAEEVYSVDPPAQPTQPSWMDPIIRYIRDKVLPEDPRESRVILKKADRFIYFDGCLLRRGFTKPEKSQPYMKCLREDESDYVLREIHEGMCGSHHGARTLVHKALRQGFYWPTMLLDAAKYVGRCDKCQRFSRVARLPATELVPIVDPVPFAQWGLDLLGPFPPASGQRRFLIVAIDYFTKWIEAEILATTSARQMTQFVWKSIISRFGLPRSIITDNGPQFDCREFRDFCAEWKVRLHFSSVAHPQSNGLAESANKNILEALRKKVGDLKGSWPDEIPGILWSYRTTFKTATGETPFMLSYGTEAVIPAEVGAENMRIKHFHSELNEDGLRVNLDMLDEVRERALLRTYQQKRRIARHFNSKVRPRTFLAGNLVLRKAEFSEADKRMGKLAPKWEGPYRVKVILGPGTYILETLGGKELAHPWNVDHLRHYYQ